jgi:methylmalonyl-CoA/ethylmalonyl-CoA epimerase
MTPAYPSRLPHVFHRIDHVGIAVPELEPALGLWRDLMGLEVALREIVEEQGVEAVLLDVGDSHVELLAPLGPKTPVGKFLAKRGPGLHHVAYEVPDIEAALDELRQAGLHPLDKHPRVGIGGSRVAFLRPKEFGRVLVEIVEPAHQGEDRFFAHASGGVAG